MVNRLMVLAAKIATTETEELFVRSLNHAIEEFRELITRPGATPDLLLENLDLDPGHTMEPGESKMIEKMYAELTTRIVEQKRPIPAGIWEYLLMHYSDPSTRCTRTAIKRPDAAWSAVPPHHTLAGVTFSAQSNPMPPKMYARPFVRRYPFASSSCSNSWIETK
jgi:hypothetical protein